jgi:FkbM family methyltransferase
VGVKNLVINRPAFHLSEKNYFRYVLAISRILKIFGSSYSLNSKEQISQAFPDQNIWIIYGAELPIKIQSQYRVSRFLKGFRHAGKRQWDRYGISNLIGLHVPDVLIDVGANIGEVSYYANHLGVARIIAVDPDPIAGECLEFNLRDTNVEIDLRALGEANGEVTFYSQSHSADSSLFKPEGKSKAMKVQSLTLDDFLIEKAVTGDVLLKMDAEGFEPEILRSGLIALEKINWVAIDAGAERGKETTVKEVFEILSLSGFEAINVSSTNIVTAKRKE